MNPANQNQIAPANVLDFITAGKAVVTLHNIATDNHFTYKICAPTEETEKGGHKVNHEADVRFVKILTGPDNENSYTYAGFLKKGQDGWVLIHGGKKAKIGPEAQSFKALSWVLAHVENLPTNVEVLHNGHCARCGRQLTVPSSLEIGLGPECAQKA